LSQLVHDKSLAGFLLSRPALERAHFDAEASPNLGHAYQAPLTWAMSATMLVDYALHLSHSRRNELLNVRYTIRRKDKPSEGTPVYSDDVWNVYENPDALPRAWIVHRVEVDPSTELPLRRLDDPEFDLRNTAIVDEALEAPLDESAAGLAGKVEWVSYGANHLELNASSAGAGMVVFSEVFYPGWKATLDETPVRIRRVNGFLRGVVLPPGNHRIVMRYEPGVVYWGALLTIATFLSVCLHALLLKKGFKPRNFVSTDTFTRGQNS
jgi:hypothetical protein